MKPKIWYKHIKAGDVLEVKFGAGHLFFSTGATRVLVEQIKVEGHYFIVGRLLNPNNNEYMTDGGCCLADFSDSKIWNDVSFTRIIARNWAGLSGLCGPDAPVSEKAKKGEA